MKKSNSKKVPGKKDRVVAPSSKRDRVVVAPPVIIKRARIDNENDQYQFGIDEDEANNNINDEVLSNNCFQVIPPPRVVDYRTLKPIEPTRLPDDFSKFGAANRAARGFENIGRLMGYITIECCNVTVDILRDMMIAVEVSDPNSFLYEPNSFNEDGEFMTPYGQISLGNLMDANKKIKDQDANEIIEHLYGLQSPQCSQWKKPFIRLVSNHSYNCKNKKLSIRYYVYFTRLIFELIANESLKFVMDRMEGIPYHVIPAKAKVPQPIMFKSDENNVYTAQSHKFSLAGLLKYAENKGYQIGDLTQPSGLKLNLYEYQLSTLKWMLDKENDDSDMGLNGEFWDEMQSTDGLGNIYYFPLAGELRLEKPPRTTGGLLSEEMGLGKTIGIIIIVIIIIIIIIIIIMTIIYLFLQPLL